VNISKFQSYLKYCRTIVSKTTMSSFQEFVTPIHIKFIFQCWPSWKQITTSKQNQLSYFHPPIHSLTVFHWKLMQSVYSLVLLPDMCLSSLLVVEFCSTMIGIANFEGSESNITMNTWLPSYPCGDFSDSSSFKFQKTKGSIGQAMLSQFVFVPFYQVPRCFHPSHSSFLAHNSKCYAAKILHYVTVDRPLRVRKFVLVNRSWSLASVNVQSGTGW
jgi:hypothetical protein